MVLHPQTDPEGLFCFHRERAATDLSDPDGGLWPVNAFSDADELNLLLEAAQTAGILRPRRRGTRVYIYPLSISEPAPLLAVSPGTGPTLLGYELKLAGREDEDPIAFTLRALAEIAEQASALLRSAQSR